MRITIKGNATAENFKEIVDSLNFVAALDLRFGHSRPDARPTRKESTGRPVLYTDETRQQVKNRHAAGLSIRKIAAELGMSPTTVAKLLHE